VWCSASQGMASGNSQRGTSICAGGKERKGGRKVDQGAARFGALIRKASPAGQRKREGKRSKNQTRGGGMKEDLMIPLHLGGKRFDRGGG